MTDSPNAAQIEFWNAQAGETWARFQDLLDRQIEPLGREELLEAVLDSAIGTAP